MENLDFYMPEEINRQSAYQYSFDGDVCKFRKVKRDGSFSEWREPEAMIIEMRD